MGTAPGSSPLGAGQAVDGEYHDEHRCGLDIAAKSCLKVFQEEPNRNRSDSAHVVFFLPFRRNSTGLYYGKLWTVYRASPRIQAHFRHAKCSESTARDGTMKYCFGDDMLFAY